MKNKYCDQIAYPDKDGMPDMANPKVCMEKATKSIKFKGVKVIKYYCQKHILIYEK